MNPAPNKVRLGAANRSSLACSHGGAFNRATTMRLKVKLLGIEAGGPLIVALNPKIVKSLDLEPADRVRIMGDKKYIVAVADVSAKISEDEIGLFDEVQKFLGAEDGQYLAIIPEEKPMSVFSIKKKLAGQRLSKDELYEIVTDIVDNRLTQVEIAFFVAAAYTRDFSIEETEYLARAIAESGEMLNLGTKPIADKHCIGGVPGNRTTMLVVPIVASTGVTIPKTSSRAITDPAGTADTMEVLAPVSLDFEKIREIVKKIKACMVWGGGLDMAPADDDIIKVEHPLSLDPTGILLASVMAKKYSVGATHVLIDIPYGPGTKCDLKRAKDLEERFVAVGKNLGMIVKTIKTDGSQPIGNGIGPALEARDVLYVLMDDKKAPQDLKKKAIFMAGQLLELVGKAKRGKGAALAKKQLESGKALEKMREIIKAQGGNPQIKPEQIKVGTDIETITAEKDGIVIAIDNEKIKRISKFLGAPNDKGAGMFLHKHVGDKVKFKEPIFTLYAESGRKLSDAIGFADSNNPFKIK